MKRKQHPEAVRVKECALSRAEGKVKVNVTLSNPGERPAFVISSVRRMDFDPETGMLTLWFSDRGRASGSSGMDRKEFSLPQTVPIEAGGERSLAAEFPEDLTRLVPHDDGTFDLEALDLSQVRGVVVHVAVGDAPFYFNPTGGDYLSQLKEWGADIRATAKHALSAASYADPETGG